MRLLRTTTVFACAVLVAASVSHARAPARPPITWLKGEGNYTKSHRPPKAIERIVVHATEGTFWGSITWLRSKRSHASSHFVVSRRGKIVQLVHQSDIAWHAGNWKVNAVSVGIEHEGITDDPGGFTRAQYRASARVAAFIARRSLMPIDRRHIIGHHEVPDPTAAGLSGGASNHTDPGSYWRWRVYLKLVRRYALGPPRARPRTTPRPNAQPKPKPKPVRLRVGSSTLYAGQVIRGTVPWRASARGPVRRVDFRVDGRLVSRDVRPPFAFPLRTIGLANGRHVLELRAFGPRGAWTRRRLVVRVRNARFAIALRAMDNELSGLTIVQGTATGARPRRVELRVDGRRVGVDSRAPLAFRWNTRGVRDGRHVLELRAVAADGRRARTRAFVVVANVLRLLSHSLVEGQPVSGIVPWEVRAAGPVARVEFSVDGVFRGNATAAPYTMTWVTTEAVPGPHVLSARVVGRDGKTLSVSVTVDVAPLAP